MGAVHRWIALVGFAFGAAGCNNPTQITLTITSDECGMYAGSTVTSITAGDPGVALENQQPTVVTGNCDVNSGTIGSLVIVPAKSNSAAIEVRVVLGVGDAGTDPNTCLTPATDGGLPAYGQSCIVARRILNYVPHQNVALPVFMGKACADDNSCSSWNGTCVNGTCVPAGCSVAAGTCALLPSDGGVEPTNDAEAAPDAPITDGPSTIDSRSQPVDSSVDSAPITPFDGGPCSATGNCYDVPMGWTIAGLDPTNTATCPTGFTTASVVKDPASACAYGNCTVDEAPSCSGQGSVSGGAFGCYVGVTSWSGDGCNGINLGTYFGASAEFSAPPPTGGHCEVPVKAGPILANAKACTMSDPALCDAGECHPNLSSPILACIEAVTADAGTCPADTAFPYRHVIAAAATSNCPSASCSISQSSCNGTAQAFADNACHQYLGSFPVNGTCNSYEQAAGSFQYQPNQPTCTTTEPTPTPGSPILTGQQILCCVQ